jgi:hypothetical protein
MRKTLILTLVLCLAAAFAYAQTSAPAAPPPTTTSSTSTSTTTSSPGTITKTTKTKHHTAPAKTAKGDIASVDDANKSFVVHPASGTDWTFKANEKTTYWVGKTQGAWADVKAGVDVTVTYKNDGTDNWATRVKIGKKS